MRCRPTETPPFCWSFITLETLRLQVVFLSPGNHIWPSVNSAQTLAWREYIKWIKWESVSFCKLTELLFLSYSWLNFLATAVHPGSEINGPKLSPLSLKIAAAAVCKLHSFKLLFWYENYTFFKRCTFTDISNHHWDNTGQRMHALKNA